MNDLSRWEQLLGFEVGTEYPAGDWTASGTVKTGISGANRTGQDFVVQRSSPLGFLAQKSIPGISASAYHPFTLPFSDIFVSKGSTLLASLQEGKEREKKEGRGVKTQQRVNAFVVSQSFNHTISLLLWAAQAPLGARAHNVVSGSKHAKCRESQQLTLHLRLPVIDDSKDPIMTRWCRMIDRG